MLPGILAPPPLKQILPSLLYCSRASGGAGTSYFSSQMSLGTPKPNRYTLVSLVAIGIDRTTFWTPPEVSLSVGGVAASRLVNYDYNDGQGYFTETSLWIVSVPDLAAAEVVVFTWNAAALYGFHLTTHALYDVLSATPTDVRTDQRLTNSFDVSIVVPRDGVVVACAAAMEYTVRGVSVLSGIGWNGPAVEFTDIWDAGLLVQTTLTLGVSAAAAKYPAGGGVPVTGTWFQGPYPTVFSSQAVAAAFR